MPRGYRLFVIALGLILVAANHPNMEGGDKQNDAQHSVTGSLQQIGSTYTQEAKRPQSTDQEEAPCGQRKYGSNADLCAQWKAADAASDSAWWAWASGIVGLGSLAGVVVALFIGLHANAIAADTAKRQLRAYVSLDYRPGAEMIRVQPIAHMTANQQIFVDITFKNFGATPAQKFRCGYSASIEGADFDELRFPELTLQDSDELAPGALHIHAVDYEEPGVTGHDIAAGTHKIVIFYKIEYVDIFGEPHGIKATLVSTKSTFLRRALYCPWSEHW